MEDKRRLQQVRIRIETSLLNLLKMEAREHKMSLGSYVNFVLNSYLRKQVITFKEKVNKYEKKEAKSYTYFTRSEMTLLKQYASLNDWSVTKEIRYRIISTLAQKPKLSKEELRVIYSLRSEVSILGASINGLIRSNDKASSVSLDSTCRELLRLIKEIVDKIDYLEKCSHTHFKLQGNGS